MAQSRRRNGISLRMPYTIGGAAQECSTETVLADVNVPPDYLQSGAIIAITTGLIKSGAVGTFTIKLYFNTTATISGATQMGTYSVLAAGISPSIYRRFVFDSATTAKGMTSSFSATNDTGDQATPVANYTISSWLATGGVFFITGLRLTGTETLKSVKMTIEV